MWFSVEFLYSVDNQIFFPSNFHNDSGLWTLDNLPAKAGHVFPQVFS